LEEIKLPEECKLKKTNPLLELLKPAVIHKSSSLQFQGPSQGVQVKQVNSINVSERQVNSFFEIFNHDYVKDFFKCDSCYLLSDKYLNAAVICLLVRSKIDPDNYRSVYFIVLYMVNEMLEESHHKCHLLAWIRDDPLLPPWILENVDTSDNELIYKRVAEVRFSFIKDLLNYRVITSLTTLLAYMRVLPSHYVWQRERCDSHKGKQLTVNQLHTTHRYEATWILYQGGKNYQKYECRMDDCKTANVGFTKGFKPFLASGINGKRKLKNWADKIDDDTQLKNTDEVFEGRNKTEIENKLEENSVSKSKNARLEHSCMLKIQESQAKVMQWLAYQEDKSLDNEGFNSISQV
jgi:hypothetical protein